MKIRINRVLIGPVLIGLLVMTSGSVYASIGEDSLKSKPKRKFIQVYRAPKDWVMLDIYNRGRINIFPRTTVLGTMKLEAEGIRFTPTTKSPEGWLPQDLYEKYYWYALLLKDLYIPFVDIRKVNSQYGTIRTKDGKKYKLYCRHFRTRFGNELKSHIK